MKRYDVTYYLKREVTITVDVPNGEDPEEYAWDELELNKGEEIIDSDYCEVDPHEF